MLENHRDDTSCQGVSFGNRILKIATKSGYDNVALPLVIFADDGTAEIRGCHNQAYIFGRPQPPKELV